jgi:hypothetical protein
MAVAHLGAGHVKVKLQLRAVDLPREHLQPVLGGADVAPELAVLGDPLQFTVNEGLTPCSHFIARLEAYAAINVVASVVVKILKQLR